MSRHHRAQKWTTHMPKLRKMLEPKLPLRCLNCPHPVTRDQRWQVGHILDAALGGKAKASNVGATHAWCPTCLKRCNQVAGGKLGAAVTNSKRAKRQDIRPW